ncbi:MAG TPA: PilX N-terminal domain-containing pilus assembly protein [Tahibacter sp.]|uniref:pilus assembly PilX family protein n=1 Tax=Tahibacter sp. TaxID=2056211 RepID=UPI002BA3C073|nr:PilX N-terminal domain-containing pilus assembly protein [Tahibacter sp.]HSX59412.1 PilX N-terminal domain-containing pilus assembly protein [Tahibacter sp.]
MNTVSARRFRATQRVAPRVPHRQRGAALFVSLMLLILVTLLALTASRMTVLQERMSGNYKNQQDAFQSAERQLTRGEAVVLDPLRQPDIAFTQIDNSNALPWTPWYADGPTTADEEVTRVRIGQSLKFGTDPMREPKFFVVSAGAPGADTTATSAVQSTYVY